MATLLASLLLGALVPQGAPDELVFNGLRVDDVRSIDTLDPTAGLYLVRFEGPIRDGRLEELLSTGADFHQYVPQNAYVVHVAPGDVPRLEAYSSGTSDVRELRIYERDWRLRPSLRSAARDRHGTSRAVTVQLVDVPGVEQSVEHLSELAFAVVGVVRVGDYVNLELDLDPVYFDTLAGDPLVFAIEERGVRVRSDERQAQIVAGNVAGGAPTGPGYLDWLASQGFDASQFSTFSVNVVDDARSLVGHPDLENARVDFAHNPTLQGSVQSGHGFLDAHILAGFNDGAASAANDAFGYNHGLGVAPWAHVGATAIFGFAFSSPSSWEASAYVQGARISTNSWNYQAPDGSALAVYDSDAQEYDFLVRDAHTAIGGNQELIVVFAAGNDGAKPNSLSSPVTAKNVLTVAASENVRAGLDGCGHGDASADDARDLADYSSRGPINLAGGDGRWKPEIAAPGTHIQAGVPQSNYFGAGLCDPYMPAGQTLYSWSSGTSHAAPAVTGGATLLYQRFLNEGLAAPSPALAKAYLCGAATYMTGAGANDSLPSNGQGMGRLDLGRVFDDVPRMWVDQTELLSATGQTFVLSAFVADPAQPVRVNLAWTDAPGATIGGPWVNDLDLTLSIGGASYLGNVFAGELSQTGGSADFRNNLESIHLPAGTSGAFTVTVSATMLGGDGVPGNGDLTDQDFALCVYNASDRMPAPLHPSFCNGDGGDLAGCTSCPCANDASAPTVGGCLNAAGTSARLIATGVASVSLTEPRPFEFTASGVNPSTFAVLASADLALPQNPANPCPAGSGVTAVSLDGLRCIASNLLRHGTRASDASGEIGQTNAGWSAVSAGFVAGQTRRFQLTYREALALQCGTGQNSSNGVEVVFVP